ncbi:hypothetical protein GEOBRER4_n3212 [Citrifermentans bremense]|uniref:Beta-lactamase n=1 Tax=Citrifermentans bremense TaxID=60035 RepID=A0A6S6MA39_9BACT|nr:hypothetical protein [Citrifermentans bremense]BCG48325.1 hypothetical protein GEOBRER4_n3212 [Citrifermentans bremense]
MKGLCRLFLAMFLLSISGQPVLADFDSALNAFRQQRYVEAATEFKKCDSAKANFYLSLMYGMGWGVVRNKKESVGFLRRAKKLELLETQQFALVASEK